MKKKGNQLKTSLQWAAGVHSPLETLGDRVEQASEPFPPQRGEVARAIYPPTSSVLGVPGGLHSPEIPAFSLGEKSPYVESHRCVW